MKKRKRSEGFNIAFLDIMSCGLGAVILILLLVKFHVDESSIESELLKKDIEELQVKRESLGDALSKLAQESQNQLQLQQQISSAIEAKLKAVSSEESVIEAKEKQLEDLKQDIASIPAPEKSEDVVQDIRKGEENYLIGLRVEGARIAILLDSSASMTNEKLVEIIKTKSGSDNEKKSAAKWQRTVRIAKWLLARSPTQSQVGVISYNKTASFLGQNQFYSVNEKNISSLYQQLDKIIPTGPTNLQIALQTVSKSGATDIYVITDGLPTTGESRYTGLNPFSNCKSLIGNQNKISGECRVKLFQHTVNESAPAGSKINVILLPIEGDPDAMYQYWIWSYLTGGLTISPAPNWP